MPETIQYAPLGEFRLDPRNPRLGTWRPGDNFLSQEEIYARMSDWSLHELATSFLESGFWGHEAVLCVYEELDGVRALVVIEGNRRIAALKRLERTYAGEEKSRTWRELSEDSTPPDGLFDEVPYMLLPSRDELDSFLGFRHVTGIKEWKPPEKARFIAKLIDERGMSYREVMRRIGSQTPVVERNYIAHCIFMQMERAHGLDIEKVKDRFSVLFLSLRTRGVQEFLGVAGKFGIEPSGVRPPIDDAHMDNLRKYTLWLFGDDETDPVVQDSRQVEKFAKVLASEQGVRYLDVVQRPDLDRAYAISGGDSEDVYELLSQAVVLLQDALSTLHHHKDDERLVAVAERLMETSDQVGKTMELRDR